MWQNQSLTGPLGAIRGEILVEHGELVEAQFTKFLATRPIFTGPFLRLPRLALSSKSASVVTIRPMNTTKVAPIIGISIIIRHGAR